MVDISVNTNDSISLSANNSSNINANTNGEAQRAKSWAVGTGLIDGVDHSSKYYALLAKQSEETATEAVETISISVEAAQGYAEDAASSAEYIVNHAPTVTVEQTETGATITATDMQGTTTATLLNGTDGQNGQNGFSPIATVTKSGNVATITITDKNGTTTANVYDGSGGSSYIAGTGIDITNDTISIDSSVVATQTDISDMATQTWVGQQGYINTPEVFIATYGTTSFSDIQTAYNANKSVFVKDNHLLVPLINSDGVSRVSFRGIDRGSGAYNFRCVEIAAILNGSSTTWDKSTYQLELTRNLVTSLSSSSTDTQYPSAKCVYNSCVIKSGDTMTGNLNFSNSGQSTIGLNGISTSSYADITYTDGSNNRLAHLRAYNDSSTKRRVELVVMNDNGSPAGNGVRVTYENSTESCEFPNTKCVDGQPVASYTLISSTKKVYDISSDISSYLPNDSNSYEVLVAVDIASNNSTRIYVGNVSSPYTNKDAGTGFCIGTETSSGATQGHNTCWIPLPNASRTLYAQLNGSSASVSASIALLGYRRLGTNS